MNFLASPVSIGILLLLVAILAIVGGPANVAEPALMQAVADFRNGHGELTPLVVGLTNVGGAYVTLGSTAAATLWLLLRRRSASALLLAATVLLERSLVDALKQMVGRPRPDFGVDWLPHSLAYPSGHSANSLTAFLGAAILLAPAHNRGPWATGALLAAFLVGLSRIYLGVHWPSDVVGGWAVGLLAIGIALIGGARLGALEPQHQIVGRHRTPVGEDEAA